MKVTVIGAGYVGLVSGACLSEMGNDVMCVDVDAAKVERLQHGEVPIHEPGLEELIRRNAAAGRIKFTTDAARAINHGTIVFIAVGTPADEDGSADLQYVLEAARTVGRHMTDYKVVVDKSTVPVGTADLVRETIADELCARERQVPYAVVANPEFLKEGAAVEDFMRPDRIIVGGDDEQALLLMRALYAPFQRNHERVIVMDTRSAELTKYAANAMLATRISFMNEMAGLAEALGADIEQVRRGIGSDARIGRHFLYAGAGYGGSCFPKDVRALRAMAAENGRPLRVLAGVEAANESQKSVLVDKVVRRFGEDLSGRRFAIWGLAFKPDTDDMREAPSRIVIQGLLERGATLVAYDPIARDEAKRVFGDSPGLDYATDMMSALDGADAVVIVTEWREFRNPDFDAIRARMRVPVIIDGRNLYLPELPRAAGLEYIAIGRPGEPGATVRPESGVRRGLQGAFDGAPSGRD